MSYPNFKKDKIKIKTAVAEWKCSKISIRIVWIHIFLIFQSFSFVDSDFAFFLMKPFNFIHYKEGADEWLGVALHCNTIHLYFVPYKFSDSRSGNLLLDWEQQNDHIYSLRKWIHWFWPKFCNSPPHRLFLICLGPSCHSHVYKSDAQGFIVQAIKKLSVWVTDD